MAVITRAQHDVLILRRVGGVYTAASLDGRTVDGTNADLADPAAEGLRSLGITPADPTNPVDADFAAVTAADMPKLLDVSELRALESALGNFSPYDLVAKDMQLRYSVIGERLIARIADLRQKCAVIYGLYETPMTGGAINLGFAQTNTAFFT